MPLIQDEILSQTDAIILQSLLSRRGPEWIARESAKILAETSADPLLYQREQHEHAQAARALHVAAESIHERGFWRRPGR